MPTNDAGPGGHRAVLRQTLRSMGCQVDPNLEEWREAGDFVTCVLPSTACDVGDPFRDEGTRLKARGNSDPLASGKAGYGAVPVSLGVPPSVGHHGPPTTIVDVLAIAGKTEVAVAATLGKSTAAKDTKDGPTSTYKLANGVEVEVIYSDGEAEWITVTPGPNVQVRFDEDAIRVLGLPAGPTSFRSPDVLRWENIGGLLEVSIFPGSRENVDYLYIKSRRP
jgi:hypothetical protein